MDEVTQQNSALVEENAATTKTLEHQAKAMDERVAFFKLKADTANDSAVERSQPAHRRPGRVVQMSRNAGRIAASAQSSGDRVQAVIAAVVANEAD
jgi:hypothetical protein